MNVLPLPDLSYQSTLQSIRNLLKEIFGIDYEKNDPKNVMISAAQVSRLLEIDDSQLHHWISKQKLFTGITEDSSKREHSLIYFKETDIFKVIYVWKLIERYKEEGGKMKIGGDYKVIRQKMVNANRSQEAYALVEKGIQEILTRYKNLRQQTQSEIPEGMVMINGRLVRKPKPGTQNWDDEVEA